LTSRAWEQPMHGRARPPGAPTNSTAELAANSISPARIDIGRKNLPHELPLWIKQENEVYFITICCVPRGKNQLCDAERALNFFETIKYRNQRRDWFVQVALLMPDHLHLLVSFPAESDVTNIISQWKAFTG